MRIPDSGPRLKKRGFPLRESLRQGLEGVRVYQGDPSLLEIPISALGFPPGSGGVSMS